MIRNTLSALVVGGILVAGCGQVVEFGTSSGSVGSSGSTGTACSTAAQCAAGEGCVSGKCGACKIDANCSPGQVCENGVCGACTFNGQCDNGGACIDGACGACKSNADCGEGEACVGGKCGACKTDEQCGSNGSICVDGWCTCDSDQQCVSGQKCVENICTAGKPTGPTNVDGGSDIDAGRPKPTPDAGPKVDAGVVDAGDPCAGKTIFATGKVLSNRTSMWTYNNLVGVQAADAECKANGADHFCRYDEIVAAAAKGELATVSGSVWVHRTTAALVGGVTNSGGAGARCADWAYATNHINQGEFATITNGQPAFDLAPANQLTVGAAPSGDSARKCGGVLRSILCCNPKCPAP